MIVSYKKVASAWADLKAVGVPPEEFPIYVEPCGKKAFSVHWTSYNVAVPFAEAAEAMASGLIRGFW